MSSAKAAISIAARYSSFVGVAHSGARMSNETVVLTFLTGVIVV
jgi:hypothetical protein